MNKNSLLSLSQTICGKTDTSEDKAAPAPKPTNRAGNAQQIKVLELANRLANEAQKPLRASTSPSSLICGPSSRP